MIALLWITAIDATSATEAQAATATWQRPIDGPVLRVFALARNHFARGQHRGVDLAAPRGTAVRAACPGRVSFAGTVPGGGRTVSVRCGRLVATYQHLDAVRVRRGESLAPGASLGTVGRSGSPRATRPHLHLGARIAATGRYIDPLSLLGEGPRTVPVLPSARAPQRRPLPLGPAPARPQAGRLPAAQPLRAAALQRGGAPARPPRTASLPWTVWTGLCCLGLGLPLGGLVTVRRRARRRTAPGALASAPS